MSPILTRLRVCPDIQAFFNCEELVFDYGADKEFFGWDFHRVPATGNLCIAGAGLRELILTSSVMEGIAFLTINAHCYPYLDDISVIALGNLPQQGQFDYISAGWHKSKTTLVFGNDILGRLMDIWVAAGIHNREIRLFSHDNRIDIEFRQILYRFSHQELSLNKFEKTAGLRSGIRTAKPKRFDTYLDQLKNDSKL